MADEGELAFVATMRDEATAQARAARRQLDSLGGDTKPITIPLNVDADTKKALAEVKRLQAQVRKKKLDLDVTTTKAKAKLAELAGQIAKEKAAIRVDANDAEARARLASLQAQADEIRLNLDVETAQPLTEIAALKAAIAATNAHIEVEVDGAKAVAEAASVNAAIDAAIDETKRVRVDLDTSSLTEASKGVPGLLAALLLLSPAILAVGAAGTVVFGGLAAGMFAAAGAAGALGLAIAPVAAGMTEAQQSIGQLQDKLGDQATALEDAKAATQAATKGTDQYRDAVAKQRTAAEQYRGTLRDLKREQKNFSDTYGPAAKGLDQVRASWKAFKADTRDSSLGVVGAFLKATSDVLDQLAPVANAAAGGVRTLIGEFRQWARGSEMKGILDFFRTEGPGAIVTFGHIAGNVLSGIMALFMAFAPDLKNVAGGLENMTAKFRKWALGLDENEKFQAFLAYCREMLPLVGDLIGNVVGVVVRLATAFAPFSTTILGALNGILSAIQALPIPVIQGLAIAIGAVAVALKAWQVGVWAVVSAQRVATVATLAYTAAQRGFATATATTAGKLGTAALGIGGVAMAAQEGGGALSVLGGAASGALAGGALGAFAGPPGAAVGAAIGGLVGGIAGLTTQTKKGADAARESIGSWRGYAATLDAVTGATTAATRAEALHNLQKSGSISMLARYGVSARTAVNAVLGNKAALQQLDAALDANVAKYDSAVDAAERLYAARKKVALGPNATPQDAYDARAAAQALAAAKAAAKAARARNAAVREQLGLAKEGIQKGREEIAVTRQFSAAIKKLPKEVRTDIEANGLQPTRKAIVDLTRRYNLTPKHVRTLIKENGGTPTKKMVQGIIAEAKRLGGMKPNVPLRATNHVSPAVSAAQRAINNLRGKTVEITYHGRRTGVAVGGNVALAGGGTVPALAPGGTVPGSRVPYRDSVLTYLAGGEEVISNARGQADRYRPLLKAINADRLAAGGTVAAAAQALARGGRSRRRRGSSGPTVRSVTKGLVASFDETGLAGVTTAQGKLNSKLAEYHRKHSANAAAAKRAYRVTQRALADEYAALKKNAKARDVIVAKIKAAKEAGAAAKDAALASLDVSSIAAVNDAPMTGGFIVKGLQDRVAALKKFQADLAELRRRGVDKALVGDLAQKGVEAGGAYASALASATSEQISAVNQAQKDIRTQAGKIGADTTKGLAAGLASELRAIDRAGTRLANALLRAVRRRLGIRSPSRELRKDGRHSVAGMIDGLRREIPAAEAQATALAARVQAAAIPNLGTLTALANATSAITAPVMRVEAVYRIEHVVTSPDGSISKLTAEQVADLIARDPKAAAKIERILRSPRARRTSGQIRSSDAPPPR